MVEFRGYQEDRESDASVDFQHLRRIWPFVRPYRRGFALALAILVASFVLELVGPWLIRLTIDGPVAAAARGEDVDPATIAPFAGYYLLVVAGGIGLGYAFAMLTAIHGQRVIRDLRCRLFGHLLRLGPRYYDNNPAGKLVTRVTTDVENLNELISTGVLQTIFDLLKIVGILGVLFWIDVGLALYTVLATPVVIGISLAFRRYARQAYANVRTRLAKQNAFLGESLGGVRTTRVFAREDAVHGHFVELNRDTRDAWLATVLQFATFFALVDLALRWSQAGMLLVGGYGVLEGTITLGVFVQFWLYFGKLAEPIKQLGEKWNVLQSAFASGERIFQILDEPQRPAPRDDGEAPAIDVPAGSVGVAFEDVHFRYVDDTPVLRGIDLDVPAGTTCAIVGPTGAGKSTLLALVSRLHDPQRGRVTFGGVPLPDLDVDALRRRIAVVQQDVFLFTGTVLDNVRLFDESIDERTVRDALATVGALDFVERLDGGLHAKVEERGATFSQGERQLLSFARALAANPDVLLLDEATANVDSESEARIQHALTELLRGRTCLVVAHRLSTVRDADHIVVIQHGRIVEQGAHDELAGREHGVYARMLAAV